MFEEPFAEGDSFIHRMDPRARLVTVAIFSLCAAVLRSVEAASVALVLGGLLAGLARPDLRALLRRLAAVNFFVAFLWIFLPFSVLGPALWSVGPFAATIGGLRLALLVTLKSNAILLAFLSLAATCGAATLGHAMYRLHVPPKLAFLFLFTYRFIQITAEEYENLRTAARLRGFRPRSDTHTYRTLAAFLGMVLVNSFERAERVRQAMLLRGFEGRFVSLREFALHRADLAFAGLLSGAAAALAVWDLLGRGMHG